MSPRALLALAALIAGGCSADPVDDDAIDDAFSDAGDKADGAGLAEGSPEALGVLRVANEAARELLTGEVGLSRRAADGIVAARPLATLAALDAVPWVGPRSLEKLLAHAEASGLVPLVVGPVSVLGSCHMTSTTWRDDGASCRGTATEEDLRIDIRLAVKPIDGKSAVEITSMREEHDLGQYVCRVVTGSGCPAVMATPLVFGVGEGWRYLGAVQAYAALQDGKLDVQLTIDGDRRETWCRGTVVHSFCTASLPIENR